MQPTPQRLLSTTARSTFESLALLFAEPAAAAPLGDGAVAARVAFAGAGPGGPARGALAVAVSAGVAAALAENMLGVDAPDPAVRRDAVGEFANVVCGHVLSEAGGPGAVFRLSAPETDPDADADAGAAPAAGVWHVWLDVEGGRACVVLDAPESLFAGSAPDAGAP